MLTTKTVILAAGTSKRLGFNKLCLRIDGKAVVRRTVEVFLESGTGDIIVVTGFERERVERELYGLPVTVIHNERYLVGMSSSIKAALPYVEGADLVLFHLGDKPFIEPATIRRVLQRYDDRRGSIVVPVHEGIKGHPVLMDVKTYVSEAGTIDGDRGLRDVVERHANRTLFVEGGEGVLLDVDTEEDIICLRRRGYIVEKG